MKNVYLKSDYSIKKITYLIILSLIPLIIGGFYKHGLKLYQLDLVTIYGLFKPLTITFLGLLIGSLVNIIYEYLIKRHHAGLWATIFSSFHPLYGILIASVMSINVNLFLFSIITFGSLLLSKFINGKHFNVMALTVVMIGLIMYFTGGFNYLNVYESGKVLHLDVMDYLLGRGNGGLNTSYLLFLLMSLIILVYQPFYKRAIPLFSSLVCFSCLFIYAILTNSFTNLFSAFFTNSILFSFIYLAPDSLSSSYTRLGKIIFSVLIGLLTFGLLLIYPPLAAPGAILVVSFFHALIDKLVS